MRFQYSFLTSQRFRLDRSSLLHLQRLHRLRLSVDDGISPADAVKGARPPIFFRRVGAFTKALGLWTSGALTSAIAGLGEAERACKRTGAPDEVIARNAVLTLARRAEGATGRRAAR